MAEFYKILPIFKKKGFFITRINLRKTDSYHSASQNMECLFLSHLLELSVKF